MAAIFSLDPSLRVQTIIPPHDDTPDTYGEIPALAVGTLVTGLDASSGYTVTWDLDGDGDYDDLTQSAVGSKTALSQSQIDALGWNVSGTHAVSALVSGGSDGDHYINDTIALNTAPVATSGVQNYLYGSEATMSFADVDGNQLTFSNFSIFGGPDYSSGPVYVTTGENTVTLHVPGIEYVEPSLYDDRDWDPGTGGEISIYFSVSDGMSTFTHQDYFDLKPDLRRGPEPGSGIFQGSYLMDDYTAPDNNGWSLSGAGGNDRLTGAAGQDRLDGGVGADVLAGAGGDDVISGGVGKDVLTGGSGSDRFIFAAGDSKAGGGLRDVITDFQSSVDKLDLSGLNITDFDAQVSYKAIGSGLIVYVDTNHNGFDYSDFGVQLTGVKALQDADFLI